MTNLLQSINVYLYRTSDSSNHDSDFFKRYILFKETGCKEIQFEFGPYGKPYVKLPGYADLHFNISHTGHYLVGAVSVGSFIGIDIECLRPIEFDCIDYFMSEQEIAQFNKFTLEEEKLDYFYTIWTLKEAYAKMLGVGLNMNLAEVSFSLKNQQIKTAVGDVCCHSMIVDNLYRLSLVSNIQMKINVVNIRQNLLIEEADNNYFK
ncbi:4'-phosphopantetheinyl transferase family protein [Lysinibacillus sphaericus]|uniref:4'-phosphopantetheinyl transferase n=1 Tax=Lysinibacillus sphaericus OT4b.31 TaxID=1285586 RepID=R7ZIK1_LYSSH|nr:4'-phosphopantetheinyl transferase superfamily protein [Lysinibacillus sphaericus]EON73886.1 4'-phosphopantetheinyl transferase [Lysinibacillus sphaericus OT4b.31]